MKVLLVCKSKVMENLGVMYLAAVAKQAGHEVRISDLEYAYDHGILLRPDIIGYSIMTGDIEKFKSLNMELKKHIKFVSLVGGPDPTFFSEGYDWADHVVRGEGENWMADFLASKRLKADAYPNIDSIPWPDRTDFPGMKIRDFISSRGCGAACNYCFNDRFAKMFPDLPRIRTRSPADVVNEILSVDPEFVYFQDSTFGGSIRWLREFTSLYKRQVNVAYHCHMRPNQVKEERVLLLHDSKCYSTRIALETASSRLRKMLNRPTMSNEEVYIAVWLLKKWEIKVMVQSMLGLPDSSVDDDMATLELNIRCHPDYGWSSIFVPFPGTDLGEQCVKEGWFDGDYSRISDSFFDSSILNFPDERKEQTYYLQKVFALAVETQCMPEISELTQERFPGLVHRLMRRLGDTRLYGGMI